MIGTAEGNQMMRHTAPSQRGRTALVTLSLGAGLVLATPLGAGAATSPASDTVDVQAATNDGTFYSDVDIHVTSGPSGENPTGTVEFMTRHSLYLQHSTAISCMQVTGGDPAAGGAGTLQLPATAVVGYDPNPSRDYTLYWVIVDRGGNGLDTIVQQGSPEGEAPDCSVAHRPIHDEHGDLPIATLTGTGRAIVLNAPAPAPK